MLSAALGWWVAERSSSPGRQDAVPTGLLGTLRPDARALAPFTMTDHHGQPFGLDRLDGRWTLMFFGYTHCPDICPAALAVLRGAATQLSHTGAAANPQIVFVSVDPERDDLQRIGTYVEYFHTDFLGLGGTAAQVTALARQFHAMYLREPAPPGTDPVGGYLISHTSSIMVVDPKARWYGSISPPHSVDGVVQRFSALLRHYDAG